MSSLPLSIAIKYLKGKRSGFLSFVSSAGFVGVALGVAVLILVSSVMNGFEKELRNKVSFSGFQSILIIDKALFPNALYSGN